MFEWGGGRGGGVVGLGYEIHLLAGCLRDVRALINTACWADINSMYTATV